MKREDLCQKSDNMREHHKLILKSRIKSQVHLEGKKEGTYAYFSHDTHFL